MKRTTYKKAKAAKALNKKAPVSSYAKAKATRTSKKQQSSSRRRSLMKG